MAREQQVIGLDNLNAYYDLRLKQARLAQVVHLAAQAGVRYSIDHPEAYVYSNLVGFDQVQLARPR